MFLASADQSSRTIEKSQLNPASQAVTTTSKSTNCYTNTIRKALKAHTKKVMKGTSDYIKHIVDMPYYHITTFSTII